MTEKNNKKLISQKKTDVLDDLDKAQKKDKAKKSKASEETLLKNSPANPIWLSIAEAAKLGGVNTKTVRRAIQSEKVKYKIYKNKYLIGLRSFILYLNSNTKLRNKLKFNGIGQYIKKWQ